MSEIRVTMRHIRHCKMCSRGAREFFARHGMDWPNFLRDGVPAEVLEQTGDAIAAKVVAVARQEHPHE